MLKKISPLVLLAVTIVLPTCFFAQRKVARKTNPNWQAGQVANVELSVRDKDGVLGQYDALFIVSSPEGKEYKARSQAEGSGDASVFFPRDFNEISPPTGKYMWRCIVADKVIIEGEFDYSTNNAVSEATADLLKIKFK